MLVLTIQHEQTMNNKIATGIWLVFIGALTLLYNFKIIDFNFYAAMQMWPIILVSIGISLLLQNRKNAVPIIVIANLLLCGLIFHRGLTSQESLWGKEVVSFKTEKSKQFQKVVSHAYNDQMQKAHLAINGGASKLTLLASEDSSNLIYSKTNQKKSSLLLDVKGKESVKLDLTTNTKNNSSNGESTEIELNTSPVWDLEFNLGVAQISGDLKKFKLKSLEINSGASTLSLHLPNPEPGISKIEVNTAASKILLYIPKNAACQVEAQSFLSKNTYEDIDIIEEDIRKSANYDSAPNKYDIEINGAANSLSILRY